MVKIILANLIPELDEAQALKADKNKFKSLNYPLGLGIIANVLKKADIAFQTIDTYVKETTPGFMETVGFEKPDLILMSGFLGNFMYAFLYKLTHKIKEVSPQSRIIIGGPIGSTIPELLVDRCKVDYAVVGEGEKTIIELLDTIETGSNVKSVKGVVFKDDTGKVVFTGDRERIKDLDQESEFPLYDAFPIQKYIDYLNKTGRCWEISTSRGCYGSCTFCKLTFGNKITSYSNQSIIRHMCYVNERYNVNRFSFVDDNFLNHPGKADEFVDLLMQQDVDFKWRFQGRADRISPEFVKRASAAGLFDISFGIESADPEILKQYGKKLDIGKALDKLMAIKDIININCNFIVGAPGETWDSIKKSEAFIKQLKLKTVNAGILMLFPGTALYLEALKKGYIKDEHEYCINFGHPYDYPYINICNLSDNELIQAKQFLMDAVK
ncbi:MAG: hypothetical protein A2277_15370 [Desulfobacterales bacterium RIFOXYA12_FULL_46_15]|nr:MAG: hypothetical protein A2277_15370 [Desulfobacterales bacterium RIFOXYA12_FULL_46_15]